MEYWREVTWVCACRVPNAILKIFCDMKGPSWQLEREFDVWRSWMFGRGPGFPGAEFLDFGSIGTTLILATYRNFVWKYKMVVLGVSFPQTCSCLFDTHLKLFIIAAKPPTFLFECRPHVCHVKITFTLLPTNCWFLVWYATTQLALQLQQERIQVVRSTKVFRRIPTESNITLCLSLLGFEDPILIIGLSG